ncbi:undecaprenyl/decaprenyl-phosphate alpha-N-acetylglucosaminyl 1-phosphate transferase [candidate division WWE3 bacterium]|nr:undecaprenyl/decaprenyl-phosphate alpha-N-acetylglucosaminyl 1-phosphate transferase [candidate division WWE3 bacterium]
MKKLRKITAKLIKIPLLEDRISLLAFAANLGLVAVEFVYILLRKAYLAPYIPLWYTKPWGDYQLAPSNYIYLIPLTSVLLTAAALIILSILYASMNKEAIHTTLTLVTVSQVFLLLSEVRIVGKASLPFPPLIDPRISELIPILVTSFLLCAAVVPLVIRFAKKYDIVTDPRIHQHPGMILKKPSARAGAVAFYLAFLGASLIFVPFNRVYAGLYIGACITTLVGLIDDKRSTNPYLRLFLLALAIGVTLVISNIHIFFFANPFDQSAIRLDIFRIPLEIGDMKFVFIPISDIFTIIWVMWIMNMLSWSNAVDGQYSGMTAITCVVTALLALRLLKIDPEQINVAKVAFVSAGASLGLLPYNWHPSKIMWGFGATTMGLVISVLSILAGTKVAVATLVLIVPTLDALITIIRRVLRGKSPVWGDKGHLHHRLLAMGYSPQKVALFYWLVTALIGVVALISSGRTKFLALLTIGGWVAFMLVVMNLKGELGRMQPQQPEK